MSSGADQANDQMVDRLIAEGCLWSPGLIEAFRATPRHHFLDRCFHFQRRRKRWQEIILRDPDHEQIRLIYSDRAIITHVGPSGPGNCGQPISSSSQPSLMAQMLEDLKLQPGLRILEVGTGTGYDAALIAYVVGPEGVVSVDVNREVLSEAWDHLRKFPERRVILKHADGRTGCPGEAPFDRIIVTAATRDLEPDWLRQTCNGGIILAPLTLGPGIEYLVKGHVRDGAFQGSPVRAAYFMPLRAEQATRTENNAKSLSSDLQTMEAPWNGWFEGRWPRTSWMAFTHSFVFLGVMQGLEILRSEPDEKELSLGISSGQAACWFEPGRWKATDEAGWRLGLKLWRDFLDLGGPRPTDYELHVALNSVPEASLESAFRRQGIRNLQYWTIKKERERGNWL
jgi:protein-L-isoaspartate(D-aspartate) O-methyltransferase